MRKINIGKQFSDDPQGRFYTDGKGSGEEFREEHLRVELSKLIKGEKILIVLDDEVEGYGSSFLTEGFAGVVKFGYMEKNALLNVLEFEYQDEDFSFYEERIKQYIEEAAFNSEVYKSTKAF